MADTHRSAQIIFSMSRLLLVQSWESDPPVDQAPLEAFRQLIENQRLIAEKIQELLRDLGTKVPGGYQAERLSEMLEKRHGGQGLYDISHSLQTEVYLIPVGAKRLPSGGVYILFFKGLLFFPTASNTSSSSSSYEESSHKLSPHQVIKLLVKFSRCSLLFTGLYSQPT